MESCATAGHRRWLRAGLPRRRICARALEPVLRDRRGAPAGDKCLAGPGGRTQARWIGSLAVSGYARRPATRPRRAHRSFDPRRVGELECDAWVAYYRREWMRFLRSAVALTRHTFGLPWPATCYG